MNITGYLIKIVKQISAATKIEDDEGYMNYVFVGCWL